MYFEVHGIYHPSLAGEIHRGERSSSREFNFADPDVRAIRKQIGFSQSKFSALIGVSIRTLQNWEQGHRHPTGPAKVLLKLVQSNPESVFTECRLPFGQ
jgi:putative transcriptional regulator